MSIKQKKRIGLSILGLLTVALFCGSILIKDYKLSSLCGNILAGVIASIILLLFTNWKQRTSEQQEARVDALDGVLDEIYESIDAGNRLLQAIYDGEETDDIQSKASEYHGRIGNIGQFQFKDKELFLAILPDERAFIVKEEGLGRYIIHTILEYNNVEKVKAATHELQMALQSIKVCTINLRNSMRKELKEFRKSIF